MQNQPRAQARMRALSHHVHSREVEAIVKRELAPLSDRVGDLERASGGKQHKHARPQMTAPLPSYSKIERAQRDLHATSPGEGSVLEDVPRNEPKELYSQAISRDTAPIGLPMDISVDQAPFEDVMSRKERQRFKRRLASEPSGMEEATNPAERQSGSRKAQTNPIRHHESSRYIRERTSDSNLTPSLDTVPTGPRKVLYLGQIPYGCQAKSIAEWCRDRDVQIVQCIIYSSEYFRTASARITVDAQDVNKVSEKFSGLKQLPTLFVTGASGPTRQRRNEHLETECAGSNFLSG